MYLPFTRASDTITKWILCFRKETINDVSNISICNNLGVIQLKGICEDLSELSLPLLSNFRINEYNTSADPLNVFKSNTNQCEAITSTDETRIRIDSEKNCQRDKTHRYMTMQIPVTKPVFMKVIGMSTCAETKLSDSEILDIMEHLLIFLDNQRSVQRLICQYFLNDNGLYDRLGTLCEERTGQIEQKKSCFEVAYCNLVMEMCNEMCVYSEDEHYNVVFMSDIQEKKNRLLVHTNFLNMASCLFPKNIMEMNSGFLFNNREKLYNLYREASLDESLLVIDIDFSDIFHDPVGKSYIESFCSVARLDIHKVLKCNFLALCCVKKIVLRFEKTHLTFDLSFLSTVEVDMYLKKCVLRNCVLFPKYLKKLKISNSFIRCSIVLPENLEEISLKDTEIIKDSTVKVDEGCRAICIDQCSGNIYIPYIEKNFHVTFGGTWSVKLVRNSDCFIDVLKMANGTFTDSLEKMIKT